MVTMWHESLYYSGAKFKQIPTRLCKPDLRLFVYLWPFIANNQRNSSFGTSDGVTQEFDKYLHCDHLDTYMCKYLYDKVCECPDYMEGETVIDCRVIPNLSYNQVGHTIVGDLKNLDG